MSKAPVKFFRNTEHAQNALKELRAHGYKPEEIGVLTRDRPGAEVFVAGKGPVVRDVLVTNIGPVLATGPLAEVLKAVCNGDAGDVLAQIADLPEGRIGFYQFGLAMGGVLISVHATGKRAEDAKVLLRRLETAAVGTTGQTWVNCPGFEGGDRMTETNPRDAEMTGDFRRY